MMLGSFYYKTKAKEALRGNWQTAMLVAFFSGILSTLLQLLQTALLPAPLYIPYADVTSDAYLAAYTAYMQELLKVPQSTQVIVLVVSLATLVFTPVLALGCNHYFVRLNKGEDLGFMGLFSRMHSIGKAFWLYVRMFVQIFLWSLLLFIPGIIAAIRYSMAPYYLAENPDISAGEALERSKASMNGQKMNFFSLMLSFIGWMLLATLLQSTLCEVNFVLGTVLGLTFQVWIAAYQNAAVAKFFCVNSETGGIKKAFDDMFGRFEEMGMDQETLDQMKAQAEEDMRKMEQAQKDDGTADMPEDSVHTPDHEEDLLD